MGLFITEGGVAGHMNHLYDNPALTFREMKQVFQAASNGELKGTEKTDGQNLQLSYDIKTSSARAARNKGNIKDGGMDAAGLAAKFGGRGALETAFTEAFAAFEAAVGRMSIEEREEVFGPNTNVYYNAEVQDPRAANLINYDLPTLTIHRVGHNEYDRETGSATGRDVSKNARKLASALDRVQGEREEGRFYVQMNAIKKLEALSDDTAANLAIARLEKVLSNAGISDNQTVGEYTVSRVSEMVDKRILLPDLVKKELLKRIFKEKGANIRNVLGMVSKEDAGTIEAIRELVADATKLKFNAIAPVEEIVHDFSVEMLRGLHSAFILDNEAEVERLRQETAKAITAIENSGSEEAIEILTKQMSKLKDVEGVSTAAEGFVFDYDGVTYKFTGNFAPMNQLLGLFKYGRGNVPPLQKVDEDVDVDVGIDVRRTVALVPGAFKPPHRGHLEMVEHYAGMADKVVVMVSPLSRKTPSGNEVGFSTSKAIWEVYLRDAGLADKVKVIRSPVNSPVSATYEFVANENNSPELAQPGDRVIPGCSTKGGDESRFQANFEKYAREGVSIADPISCAFVASGEALSASDFRAALDTGDGLERFVPKATDPNEILSILGVESKPQPEIPTMESMLTDLVHEMLNERNEQKNRYMEPHMHQDGTSGESSGDEIEEISAMGGAGGGSVEGSSGSVDKDEEPSLIREKEVVVERVLNYLLQNKGLQHG
jgi:nicotinamide mononucleotide adenylyltransferase